MYACCSPWASCSAGTLRQPTISHHYEQVLWSRQWCVIVSMKNAGVVCSGVEIRGVHATFALVHARFDCHQRFISWISGILDVFMAQVGCLETSLKPPSSLHYIKVVFPDQKEQQISVDSFMGLLKLKRHFVFLKWRVYCWSKCSVLVILDRILNWWNPMKVRFKWKDVTINNLSKELTRCSWIMFQGHKKYDHASVLL